MSIIQQSIMNNVKLVKIISFNTLEKLIHCHTLGKWVIFQGNE